MRVIALVNLKGGVGKTTTTINIGAGLRQLGKKILLVDLDPQAHLTYSLGIPAHELKLTVYELLKGESKLDKVVFKRKSTNSSSFIDVVPSSINLSGAEIELSGMAGREFLLKEILEGLGGYDYVLMDCPPSLGVLTLNALTSAQEAFIPLQTEYLALQGMAKLVEMVQLVKRRLNPGLEITGIIGTRFHRRKKLNQEVVEKIKESFGNKLFSTLIRDNIALAEAPSFGKTIFEYRPESAGAEDYMNLCKEILQRGKP
ncbi:MAG: ParA family protein [Nitrospirota bacterium]